MPTQPPLPGKCIHCLGDFDELTWDHVLPQSWYPEGAINVEKWRAPSCKICNHQLGKLEEDLLTKLGLCLNQNDRASLGIADRVLRSLNPGDGRSDRDRRYRGRKRARVLQGVRMLQALPTVGVFPNFGPNPGTKYASYPALQVNEEEVTKFGAKIAKGVAFVADGSYIDQSYDIQVSLIEDPKATDLKALVDSYGTVFDLTPGMLVKRALVEHEKVAGIYFIDIWGRFRMYVVVKPKNLPAHSTNAGQIGS